MAMDVVDADGHAVRGEVGELVCRRPWPGMTRGFWRDPERYLDTYWRRFPGVWTHGDWASVDEDGYWFLHGRSDDTLNIAGKRIGPAELESAALGHARGRGGRGDRRAARGQGRGRRGSSVVLEPGAEDGLPREVAAPVAGELGQGVRARPRPVRVARCRRRAGEDRAPRRARDARSAPTRATSRRSRTPRRWRRSQTPLAERIAFVTGAAVGSARTSRASSPWTAGRSRSRRGPATRSRTSRATSAAARVGADVARRESTSKRMFAEAGPVELLVNNAGIGAQGPDLGGRPGDWWHVFEVNVLGVYLCCRAVDPGDDRARRRPIVIRASGAAYLPGSLSALPASKAALHRFGEMLASDWRGRSPCSSSPPASSGRR